VKRFILRFFLVVCLACLVVAPILVGVLASSGCSASQQRTAGAITVVSAGAGVTALQLTHHDTYRTAVDALHAQGIVGTAYDIATRPLDAEFRARGEAIQLLARAVEAVAVRLDDPNAPLDIPGSLVLVDGAIAFLQRGAVLPPLAIPAQITEAVAALRALAGSH
jgi:hypothetical protein